MTTLLGKPALGPFAGGNALYLASATSIFATPGSARTIILVKQDLTGYPALCERTSDPCQYYGLASSTVAMGDETNGAQNVTLSSAPPFTDPHYVIYSLSGAGNAPSITYKRVADGSPVTATVASGVQGTESGTAGYSVGRSGFPSYYSGSIAEIICYEKVLSGTELGKIKTYLFGRYGI